MGISFLRFSLSHIRSEILITVTRKSPLEDRLRFVRNSRSVPPPMKKFRLAFSLSSRKKNRFLPQKGPAKRPFSDFSEIPFFFPPAEHAHDWWKA
jgi:hypothetical protein